MNSEKSRTYKKPSSKQTHPLIGLVVAGVSLLLMIVIFQVLQANKITVLTIKTANIPLLKAHPHIPSLDSISDAGHHVYTHSDTYIVPDNIWVKGVQVTVKNAGDQVIHHLFLARTDKNDELCPNYPWQAFFVTSEVNAYPQIFPQDYGIFLPKGTPLKIFAMLHNAAPPLGPGKAYQNVSVEVSLLTQKESIFKKHVSIEYHRLHLSDKPCADAERAEIFEVPPHQKEFTKKESSVNGRSTSSYTFPSSGAIVGMGGHFHPFEGGQDVEVDLSGGPFYTFYAQEQSHGYWKTWTIPINPSYVRVKKNDTVSISSSYSNPNGYSIRGAMGMAVFYFAKD